MSSEELPLNIPVRALVEFFQCPVCMCQLQAVHVTPCGHRYCQRCITETIDRHHCCPCCRKPLVQKDMIRDAHFQELIERFNKEKVQAEKDYFNNLIETACVSNSEPSSGTTDATREDVAQTLHSPVEQVLKTHLKQSLLLHHNYTQKLRQSFYHRIQQAKNCFQDRVTHIKEQSVMGTDIQAQVAVEEEHHREELARLQAEMKECAQLAAEAYDRYLQEHIPTPSVLPIRVSINILSKNRQLSDILIQPHDSISDIMKSIESHMERLGDKIVMFEKNVRLVYFSPGTKRTAVEMKELSRSLVEIGATHPHVFVLPEDSRPVVQFELHSGGEIWLYGGVKFESDLPKRCFASTFNEEQEQTVDYFTCRDCAINWVCRSCMSECHSGHTIVPYILNHQPTWPCCYCPKKKKCHIAEK